MNIFCVYIIIIACLSLTDASSTEHLIVPKFGTQFVGNAFQIYIGMSWIKCTEKCKGIRKCKWVNYYPRMSGLCELFADGDSANPSLEPRESVWCSSKSNWEYDEPTHCETCSDNEMCTSDTEQTCKIVTCPHHIQTAGAKLFGNRNNIGASRLYVCGNRKQRSVKCLEDGSWSNITIINCFCTLPNINHASLNVTESENGMEATIICDSGYAHLGVNKAQCDEISKEWTTLERSACVTLHDDSRTFLYGKIHGTLGGLLDSWEGDVTDTGDYRNSWIISTWNEHNINQVKIEVIDFSDNVAVTLTFDGTGEDVDSWFSQDNLVESSWTDLTTGSVPAGVFRIGGTKAYVADARQELVDQKITFRWGILDYDAERKKINCSSNKVWLAIMKTKYHPCEDIKETRGTKEHIIVYSNSDTGTTWNDGQWKLAKMMLIYVQLEE